MEDGSNADPAFVAAYPGAIAADSGSKTSLLKLDACRQNIVSSQLSGMVAV
jgi:hypothetical protein